MKDIRKKSDKDLHEMLTEKRDLLRSARFDMTGTKVKNVREIRNSRRDVARILTILNERAREEVK